MKNLLTFLFLMAFLSLQAQKQAKFNGWEFLEWDTDSALVNKKLDEKQLRIDPFYERFEYQGMFTRLFYHGGLLQKVEQRKTFSINQKDESKKAYEDILERMIKSYGRPHAEKNDTAKQVVQLVWDLRHTRIGMEYDYGYKVVDELGAGSYWVEIAFEQHKRHE